MFAVVAEKPKLEKAPYWMTRPCPRLFKYDRATMPKAQAIAGSVAEDKLYEDCRLRHAAYVAWIAERDRKVMGLREPAPKKTRRGKIVPKGPTDSIFSIRQ
jgi:hypothetical protein